jgi:hypothetical protein
MSSFGHAVGLVVIKATAWDSEVIAYPLGLSF